MALKTIFIKGRGIGKEGVAGGTVLPGALVKVNSSGQIINHATAGGPAARTFARENELAGKGISDAYAANDTLFYESASSGFEINTFVAASAAAIVIGDQLTSNGAGGVKKANGTTDLVVGTALQAVDNSANGAGPARILMEVL